MNCGAHDKEPIIAAKSHTEDGDAGEAEAIRLFLKILKVGVPIVALAGTAFSLHYNHRMEIHALQSQANETARRLAELINLDSSRHSIGPNGIQDHVLNAAIEFQVKRATRECLCGESLDAFFDLNPSLKRPTRSNR